MKYMIRIFAAMAVLLAFTGCFKEEKQGTRMRIALYSQNVDKDPVMKTTSDIEGYAFWVEKASKWEVTTWEDALDRRIKPESSSYDVGSFSCLLCPSVRARPFCGCTLSSSSQSGTS